MNFQFRSNTNKQYFEHTNEKIGNLNAKNREQKMMNYISVQAQSTICDGPRNKSLQNQESRGRKR